MLWSLPIEVGQIFYNEMADLYYRVESIHGHAALCGVYRPTTFGEDVEKVNTEGFLFSELRAWRRVPAIVRY